MFPNIQLVCCRELLIYFSPLLFNDFKQFDSQNVTNQMDDLNVDFALKLSNYTSLTRFICLKWILNFFPQYYILSSTTIHCWSLPLIDSLFLMRKPPLRKTNLIWIRWTHVGPRNSCSYKIESIKRTILTKYPYGPWQFFREYCFQESCL